MPYVLAFNRPAIEERMTRLAAYLGLPDPGFDAFLEWVLALRRTLAIPHTAAELGVERSRVDALARAAVDDPSTGGNPRDAGFAEMRALYLAALEGRLETKG